MQETYLVLGEINTEKFITTYKIGTQTLRKSVIKTHKKEDQYIASYTYLHSNEEHRAGNFKRTAQENNINYNNYTIAEFIKSDNITCLIRDPRTRFVTGFIQDFCDVRSPFLSPFQEEFYKHFTQAPPRKCPTGAKVGYHIIRNYFFDPGLNTRDKNPTVGDSTHLDNINRLALKSLFTTYIQSDLIFQSLILEFSHYAMEYLGKALLEGLCLPAHMAPYHKGLYHLITTGRIKNPTVKHIQEVQWPATRPHSNKVLSTIMHPVIEKTPEYKKYIDEELKYYELLKEL